MQVTPIGKRFFKHKVGEVFELPEKAALKLIAAGLLARAESQEPDSHSKRTYQRRDLRAQSI